MANDGTTRGKRITKAEQQMERVEQRLDGIVEALQNLTQVMIASTKGRIPEPMEQPTLESTASKRRRKSMEDPCDQGAEQKQIIVESMASQGRMGELCDAVLETTFKRLSFVDVARARRVCSRWNSVIKSLMRSSSCYTESHQVPWLLLLSLGEQRDILKTIYNPAENRVYNIQSSTAKEIAEFCLVGSSHGCLFFLNRKLTPLVLNPITGARIQLPQICDLVGILGVFTRPPFGYNVMFHDRNISANKPGLRSMIIRKAILSSDPFCSNNNYKVVILYYYPRGLSSVVLNLAFCEQGGNSWKPLEGKHGDYTDIMLSGTGNMLYALRQSGFVECWDLCDGSSPAQLLMQMQSKANGASGMAKIEAYKARQMGTVELYLVESNGRILVAVMYRRRVVGTEASSTSGNAHHFEVYELDIRGERWVEVETLDDCALFLDSNHQAVAVSRDCLEGCVRNCIYFSDGADCGVFSLEDEKVTRFKALCSGSYSRGLPDSSCWILPSPW